MHNINKLSKEKFEEIFNEEFNKSLIFNEGKILKEFFLRKLMKK